MARIPILSKRNWNQTTSAHLACRAGFSPTLEQWNRLSGMTPEEAVETMMTPAAPPAREQTPDWTKESNAEYRHPNGGTWKEFRAVPEKERRKIQQAFNKEKRQRMETTRRWWLNRMVNQENPFEEKLALFFHGHFATSFQKVNHPAPMLRQNLMFREKGQGKLSDLLEALSSDPAMLKYLDNDRSRRKKPNENYARELLELFSLGEGHYTEEDVRNAARAFTGWTLTPTRWEFIYNERRHDPGVKTFMGDQGAWTGQDIIHRIVANPRASEYLAESLWAFYASEIPNQNAIRDISTALQESDMEISAGIRTLLLHQDFYHPKVIRGKIKSPVELSVGLVRTLQCPRDLGKYLQNACRNMGQSLFDPPTVKGWDGGAAWITASNLAMRYNAAERVVKMKNSFSKEALLPDSSITREQARDQLMDRFYFSRLREKDRKAVDRILANLPPPSDWSHQDTVQVLNHLVQQPQYQLM